MLGRLLAGVLASGAAMTGGLGPVMPAHAVVIQPFEKRYEQSLYGDFITVGNTVLACPAAPPATAADCANTTAGIGSMVNNNFIMSRANYVPLPGAYDSSSGRLTVPAGATVAYARLFWGGNNGELRGPSGTILTRCDISQTSGVTLSPGDPATAPALIRVAGGAVTAVPPQISAIDPVTLGGPHYYTAEAEVTSAFAGAPTGTPIEVDVGDVWAADGLGCVAGWSLTLVYSYPAPNPNAPARRDVFLFGGHVLQRSADPATTIPISGFYRSGTQTVHASVTAYEGDFATTGDQFLINNVNIPEPQTGATNNFFNSHADGDLNPAYKNNLSIDAENFSPPFGTLAQGSTSATLTFRTRGDTYVAQQLAVSVPVPDLQITKRAAQKVVHPGDTVTYEITVTNVSAVDFPDAKLSDDLTGALDDAVYAGDATATGGQVTYAAPMMNYVGDIAAGQTVTIRYSVIVGDPVRGDGRLLNEVVAANRRITNCDAGSSDPTCLIVSPVTNVIPAVIRPSASAEPAGTALPATGTRLLPEIVGAVGLVVLGGILMAAGRFRRGPRTPSAGPR
ncbi:DUF7927 domain-containing protein [Hamadaea tsunoensis]|uniref:DUF7927 domain-containing protein n=1 Tax=Hamadaea tsunoensis TaxID=53368 RepID=UPI00146FA61F|nr:DUF11 domain-containing protein [Hamadaea tsunoensis]